MARAVSGLNWEPGTGIFQPPKEVERINSAVLQAPSRQSTQDTTCTWQILTEQSPLWHATLSYRDHHLFSLRWLPRRLPRRLPLSSSPLSTSGSPRLPTAHHRYNPAPAGVSHSRRLSQLPPMHRSPRRFHMAARPVPPGTASLPVASTVAAGLEAPHREAQDSINTSGRCPARTQKMPRPLKRIHLWMQAPRCV